MQASGFEPEGDVVRIPEFGALLERVGFAGGFGDAGFRRRHHLDLGNGIVDFILE